MKRIAGYFAILTGLALAGLLHAGDQGPPVYDGLPLPTAPYNYVSPPPDLRSSNQPPSSGESIFPFQNGKMAGGGVETVPDGQVIVFFGLDAIRVSSSAVSVRVRIDPVTTPPGPPAGSVIHGNVYRISAVEQPGGAPATVTSYLVTLRFPPGPFQELQFYDGTHWHPLQTKRAPGGDQFAGATLTAFGDVAATAPVGAQGDSIFTVVARILEGYGLLAFILVFGAIAIAQEIRRRRKKT